MDLRATAFVTAAITAKRFAPTGKSVARAAGIIVAGAGVALIAQAAGLHTALMVGRRHGPLPAHPS
jgi:hypothetical protein